MISESGEEVELTKADYIEIMKEITKEVWLDDYAAENKIINLLKNCRNTTGFAHYLRRCFLSDRTRE